MKNVLITGGAGFIGSNLVHYLLDKKDIQLLNIDKLTYAGNLASLEDIENDPNYHFLQGDICDAPFINKVFNEFKPDLVLHLAAESHVDRSIDGPADFLNTNIMGTYVMLDAANTSWQNLDKPSKKTFRFLHISTDEVFGSLGKDGAFDETTAYDPRSPYSASKASSDHLVRAWQHTYGLPTLITNCSNNYGPFQFPEKLIPVIILNALQGKPIPVYGKGENVRDWLFVEDHVAALWAVINDGLTGSTYCIGGNNEQRNIDIVRLICDVLNEMHPNAEIGDYKNLISFVTDRPGHDLRYAIDAAKIKKDLNWQPQTSFDQGMRKTVSWYLAHLGWCKTVLGGEMETERLGLKGEKK